MKKKTLIIIGCLCCCVLLMKAQEQSDKNVPEKWNIKSNLLYDATGTINLGFELPLAERWSLDVSGNYNGWNWKDNRKWKHWMAQPEVRLWTRQALRGHFFALHALGGQYNIGNVHFPFGLFKDLRDYRHDGWYAGGGIGYGYRWNFSRHWGMEAEAAVGYVRFDYKSYECFTCGEFLNNGTRNYVGPTKLAVSLVYRFGKKARREAPVPVPYIAPVDTVYRTDTVFIEKRDTVVLREEVKEVPAAPVIITRSEQLHLRYKQGNSDILPTFSTNAGELSRVRAMIDEVKSDKDAQIKRIVVLGYASPEGNEDSNLALSTRRATGLRNYLASQYPAQADLLTVVPGGEDWAGLLEAVEKDLLVPECTEVMRIVNRALNGDVAKAKYALKALSGGRAYYYLVGTIYPQLRRVECRIEYTSTKKE